MEDNLTSLEWHTEQRRVSDLIPWEKNPRRMTDKQAADLRTSLERLNLMSIPVVDLDNTIISGHQRMKIMQILGRGEEVIDVRVPNRKLTDDELKEANLRENKNLGEWDFDLLSQEFEKTDLINFGFDECELLGNFSSDAEIDILKEGLLDNQKKDRTEGEIRGGKKCPNCGFEL